MKYRKSFYDHACTEDIADHVIVYDLWYQLHDTERGNEQVMYVGWDEDGERLWEIGIELFPEGVGFSCPKGNSIFYKSGGFMKADSLAKMKKLQMAARERILKRGKIEFRVEPELLSALLDLAKERKIALGPMIRQWVKARLEQETKLSPAPPSQLDVIERKIDRLLSNRRSESA